MNNNKWIVCLFVRCDARWLECELLRIPSLHFTVIVRFLPVWSPNEMTNWLIYSFLRIHIHLGTTYFWTRYCSRASFNRPTASWPWAERLRLPTTELLRIIIARAAVREVIEIIVIVIVELNWIELYCIVLYCILVIYDVCVKKSILNGHNKCSNIWKNENK